MELSHSYTPAIVNLTSTPSGFVKLKAMSRIASGIRPHFTGMSSGVMHFQVPSSTRNGLQHRVEYDTRNHTFRCSCEAGFYGLHCTDIELINMCIDLP